MIYKIWMMIENTIRVIVYRIMRIDLSEEVFTSVLQFIKFGMVGVINNIICYVAYLILIKVGFHYMPANIIGFSVSVLNSYYWNNKYVFVIEGKREWWKTFIKTYISYAGTGIVLSNILLFVWIDIMNLNVYIAPILNLIVTIPINYLVNKLWAYKSK